MPSDFTFEDTPEFVWADLPGNEFADSAVEVVRLANPVAINTSTKYKTEIVRGGGYYAQLDVRN